MPPIAAVFGSARCSAEVLDATSRFLMRRDDLETDTFDRLGIRAAGRIASLEDLERCIGEVRVALDTLPMTDRDEERVHRLLGYLMLASLRAQQLS
jgi:hypothetical protein